MIDVLITCYNKSHTIERCLDSVFTLDFPINVIVVDDCSSDDSFSVLTNFKSNRFNFRLLSNAENLGVSRSRNILLSESRSDVIMFLDGDDVINPFEKLNQIRAFIDGDFSFSYSKYQRNGFIVESEPFSFHALEFYNFIPFSSVLLRKSSFRKIDLKFEQIFHEDYWLWLNLLREFRSDSIYFHNEATFEYGTYGSRLTRNKLKSAFGTFMLLSRYRGYPYIPFRYLIRKCCPSFFDFFRKLVK